MVRTDDFDPTTHHELPCLPKLGIEVHGALVWHAHAAARRYVTYPRNGSGRLS